ncbi:hypothetical protein [Parathalassolituus penaei]|uniref:Tetratricopeptide repeat protein n=1 Tax=Parathalassolituus penaei TaxID=2997323 RepID=A0A9X3EDY1_9GAMM|nr:hypothetical protein [Parathalassolituus penaei]MCY0964930.1 hypothetical protein [Parathalassolituus penaei]
MRSRSVLWLSMFLLVLFAGCATYGSGINKVLDDVNRGDLVSSENELKKALKPDGSDALLYYLELGAIQQMQGNYRDSNASFDQAEAIAEKLETVSVSAKVLEMMSNPRQGPYRGATHEKVLINYYKAINYLQLAASADSKQQRQELLEGARVESRRILVRLNDLESQIGSYEQLKDDEASLFGQLMNIYGTLMGNLFDMDELRYREDAMAYYLTGLSFEMNGELDDARISYEQAAHSYEDGFAKQFRLGSDITAQAWFDVVRVMRQSGNYENEWRALAEAKLTQEQRDQLASWDGKAQLVVIEHKGNVPQLEELNLEIWANPALQAFQIQPYLTTFDLDAWAWFYVLYADKGLFNIITGYLDGTRNNRWFTPFVHTELLGPGWQVVQSIGLDRAIGNSMRVTVPYYRFMPRQGDSTLITDGKTLPMIKASSPAQIALQEKLVSSTTDIRTALARASMKALTASEVGSKFDSSGLLALVGKLAAQLTEAAETRSWLLLPAEIRIRRVALEPGEHQLTLNSKLDMGKIASNSTQVSVQAGDIRLWEVRALAPDH